MFKNRITQFALLAAFAVVLGGCGEYEKLLKSRDYKAKYEMGVKYYEEGEYARAGTLFDQVANIYRGTTKADTVKYYQAKSYYGQRDYMMAGYYFNELSTTNRTGRIFFQFQCLFSIRMQHFTYDNRTLTDN